MKCQQLVVLAFRGRALKAAVNRVVDSGPIRPTGAISMYDLRATMCAMESERPPLDRLGLAVGHHTDEAAKTGMTAFILRAGASIGINVAGGSAGTFNTPIFGHTSSGETAHAVVLTGGSMYGLASVHGVLRWLEDNGIGRVFGGALVPDVTGAVIFGLMRGRGVMFALLNKTATGQRRVRLRRSCRSAQWVSARVQRQENGTGASEA